MKCSNYPLKPKTSLIHINLSLSSLPPLFSNLEKMIVNGLKDLATPNIIVRREYHFLFPWIFSHFLPIENNLLQVSKRKRLCAPTYYIMYTSYILCTPRKRAPLFYIGFQWFPFWSLIEYIDGGNFGKWRNHILRDENGGWYWSSLSEMHGLAC
jgi:hypothetical protein